MLVPIKVPSMSQVELLNLKPFVCKQITYVELFVFGNSTWSRLTVSETIEVRFL